RFRMFSRARVLVDKSLQIICLRKVEKELKDVVLLPSLSENYYHFLFETFGTYLLIPEQERRGKLVVFGGARNGVCRFHRQIFGYAGQPNIFSFYQSDGQILVTDSIWSNNPSWQTLPRPSVARKLIQTLQPNGEASLREAQKQVFFYRRGQRKYPAKIFCKIEQICRNRNIDLIEPSQFSVQEQIELMSKTRLLIVESGAAVANALFMPPDSVLIVLITKFGMKDCFVTIPYVKNIKLIYVTSDVLDIFFNPIHTWTEPLPDLDIQGLERAIDVAVKWLDRRMESY
ncbi:MAG TPA: glycosyltransferase family 61 protein, partial [Bdellovibrio sp.]|nr:glycosyltransferase family 61 protein [Bdellovibrio sp.]